MRDKILEMIKARGGKYDKIAWIFLAIVVGVFIYRPGAWIDKSKTKVGYEIPFTRTFYEYEELEPAADIAKRIAAREKVLMEKLQALFGNGGGQNE